MKIKINSATVGIICAIVVSLVFLLLRLTGIASIPWWIITAPIWITGVIVIVMAIFLYAILYFFIR